MDRSIRILLLEDSPDDALLIEHELRQEFEFSLTRVGTEQEFTAALDANIPDVILSDYKIPGSSGMEALAIARRTAPETPFILVSGVVGEEIAVDSLKEGASDFVVKSRLGRLPFAIRRALQHQTDRNLRQRAEAFASETERKFAALTETAPCLIFIHQDGQLKYVNAAAHSVLGYTREEAIGRNFWEAIHPDHRDSVRDRGLNRQGGSDELSRYEFPVVTKAGEVRWLDCASTRIMYDGRPAVLGSAFDITDRQNQQKRQLALSKLDRHLGVATSPRDAAEAICEVADVLFGWDSCALTFYSPEADSVAHPVLMKDIVNGERQDVLDYDPTPTQPTPLIRSVLDHGPRLILRETPEFTTDAVPFGNTSRPSASLMFVPVRNAGRVIGLVTFQSYKRNAYMQSDLDLLQDLADRCGGALDRLRVAEELREKELRFQHLCESLPIGVFEADATGNWTYCNSRIRAMFDVGGSECSGWTWLDIVDPEQRNAVRRAWMRAVADGQTWWSEHKVLTRHGRERCVQMLATTQTTKNGEFNGYIGIVEDVTDRRQAEAAMRELASIVRSSQDGIIALTVEGRITTWNKAAEAIYGYMAEEVIGQPLKIVLPKDRLHESVIELMQHADFINDFETVRMRKDGSLVHVSLTISKLLDTDGNLTGYSTIVRDITERRKLQNDLLNAIAVEQQRLSHELHDGLGQFLTGIAFKAKMLEDDLSHTSSPHISQASRIVELLNNSVRQSRALARGLDPIQLEAKDLASALGQLAEQTRELFRVRCDLDTQEVNGAVSGPVGLHLYRIAQESITNAMRHGHAHKVEVALSWSGDDLLLRIQDDGCGFTDPTQGGMGLRVMRYRAQAIGGILTVTSNANNGTEVRCLVPRTLCSMTPATP
jgi:PAS domain S-box-containing protein